MKQLPTSLSHSTDLQRGFTLVELVVTIALVAILTSLAIPSFSEALRQWRRDNTTRGLLTSLQLARTESIKTSRQVIVCPSTDETSCAASTEWNTGWIVFRDDGGGTAANANNQALDANEPVLKVASAQAGIASLTSTGGVQLLQFMPNVLMASPTTTFTVTPTGASSATKVDRITVSRVGRVSVVTELP